MLPPRTAAIKAGPSGSKIWNSIPINGMPGSKRIAGRLHWTYEHRPSHRPTPPARHQHPRRVRRDGREPERGLRSFEAASDCSPPRRHTARAQHRHASRTVAWSILRDEGKRVERRSGEQVGTSRHSAGRSGRARAARQTAGRRPGSRATRPGSSPRRAAPRRSRTVSERSRTFKKMTRSFLKSKKVRKE